jgi:hypothetical protein
VKSALKVGDRASEATIMRKRRVRRPRAGQDEMWFTVPASDGATDEADVAEPPARHEEPTYEDPWYQVLRRRLGERASSD